MGTLFPGGGVLGVWTVQAQVGTVPWGCPGVCGQNFGPGQAAQEHAAPGLCKYNGLVLIWSLTQTQDLLWDSFVKEELEKDFSLWFVVWL